MFKIFEFFFKKEKKYNNIKTLAFFCFNLLFTTIIFIWPEYFQGLFNLVIEYHLSKKSTIFYVCAGAVSFFLTLAVTSTLFFLFFILYFFLAKLFKKNIIFVEELNEEISFNLFYFVLLLWSSYTDSMFIKCGVIVATIAYLVLDSFWVQNKGWQSILEHYKDRNNLLSYQELENEKKLQLNFFCINFFFFCGLLSREKYMWFVGGSIFSFIKGAFDTDLGFLTPAMQLDFFLLSGIIIPMGFLYVRLQFKFGFLPKEFDAIFPSTSQFFFLGKNYKKLKNFLIFVALCFFSSLVITFYGVFWGYDFFEMCALWKDLSAVERTYLVKQDFLKE